MTLPSVRLPPPNSVTDSQLSSHVLVLVPTGRRWRLNLVAKRLNLVATCNNFGELQLDENGGGQCTGDMAGIERLEIFPAHQL